jgi:chromosomal replication initiator protein
MQRAPEVAESPKTLLDTVASALRQRLGKDRMEVWFGSGTRWSVTDTHTIRIEVASEFLANCINTMFRSDLQGVVAQYFGPDWGVVVAAPPRGNTSVSATPPPEPEQIAYDSKSTGPTFGGTAPLSHHSSPIAKNLTAAPALQSLDPVTAESDLPVDSSDVAISPTSSSPSASKGPNLRLVRAEGHRAASMSAAEAEEAEVERLLALRKQSERRWEDFVEGEHNRFAYTGAQMVLERPGQISPFLIFGPHGVGKSHLASAISQRLRQQYRMRRVLQLTGEQFTIEYTESARGGGFANFRRKYRDVEALIIDDVQFCLGKSGTLAELRNTIDMLLRENRQVVLVADRGIRELSGLGADLYARLSGGMCCGIDPVDCATRQELLRRLCERYSLALDTDALQELAVQCGGDARILQGVVHRLLAQQRLQGSALRKDDALRCTSDLCRASQPVVRLNDIERVVCEAFGLEEEMLRAKSKCQSISQPRMLAMFLARKYTRTALSEIGEYFGKRQHSTVISAQHKVEQWLTSDNAIRVGRNTVHVREILKNLEAVLQVG